MRIYLVALTTIMIIACPAKEQTTNINDNSTSPVGNVLPADNSNVINANTNTVESIEYEAKRKVENEKQKEAVLVFVKRQFPGWTLEGSDNWLGENICEEDENCTLHLVKGSQNKMVTVILKRFQKKLGGTEYWYVYEARQIDLAKARIAGIKEGAVEEAKDGIRDEVLENLEYDDCSEICNN